MVSKSEQIWSNLRWEAPQVPLSNPTNPSFSNDNDNPGAVEPPSTTLLVSQQLADLGLRDMYVRARFPLSESPELPTRIIGWSDDHGHYEVTIAAHAGEAGKGFETKITADTEGEVYFGRIKRLAGFISGRYAALAGVETGSYLNPPAVSDEVCEDWQAL